MEINFIYVVLIILIALMITNRDKVWRAYKTAKYCFLAESTGVFSMISCTIHKKDNRLKGYPDRKGMVAVVTGGGRGIGPYLVRELTKCGMHVIVGVRNPKSCKELDKVLKEESYSGSVEIMQLDVASLKSVRAFAAEVKSKFPEINLLVNNAGIIYVDFELTEDNFESHMATNYFGHFYLTHLLLTNLKNGGQTSGVLSRIVNVSSCAHLSCGINFDDINWKMEYFKRGAYGQSKTALVMMARYLNRELERQKFPIRAYSVHPGVVDTSMVDIYRQRKHLTWFLNKFLKSPLEGATTIAYACLDEELDNRGGMYISNCKEGWSSVHSKNESNQFRLHEMTCRMLDIKRFGEALDSSSHTTKL